MRAGLPLNESLGAVFFVQSTWRGIFEPSASHSRTLNEVLSNVVRGRVRALGEVFFEPGVSNSRH